MAYAAIIGGVLSAVGGVAGGALSGEKTQKSRVAAGTLDRNASLQMAQFQNLLDFGIVDYASIFQASPFSRAIGALNAAGLRASDNRQKITEALEDGLRRYRGFLAGGGTLTPAERNSPSVHPLFETGIGGNDFDSKQGSFGDLLKNLVKPTGGALEILSGKDSFDAFTDFAGVTGPSFDPSSGRSIAATDLDNPFGPFPAGKRARIDQQFLQGGVIELMGFDNVFDFFDSQIEFERQIEPIMQESFQLAQQNRVARLSAQQSLNQIVTGLPDASAQGIENLSGRFEEQLLRDLNLNVDEQRDDFLALANAGNFNPAGTLGDLEEFRAKATQDADLEAMNRALTLIGGQQTAASNSANILSSFLQRPTQNALGIAGLDFGGTVISPGSPGSSNLGAGINQGLGDLGQTISNIPIINQNQELIEIARQQFLAGQKGPGASNISNFDLLNSLNQGG